MKISGSILSALRREAPVDLKALVKLEALGTKALK